MGKIVFITLVSLCISSNVLGIPVADFLESITVRNCGTSIFSPESTDRIVGGTNAKAGQYPWMVSLQEQDRYGFEHACGAAVLNENWIITAAHCIDFPRKPYMYQALVGLHHLSEENAKTVQVIKISKIIMHKAYNDQKFENDIALLRTAKPINFKVSNGYVNGICLPTSKVDPTGYAKVIGWGHTRENGRNSNTLKEVIVPIVPRDKCNKAYDDDPYDGIDEITKTMICAGMNKKDSCQNDSGGPLFQTRRSGVSTLIGIVSHGAGCGEKYYPGVYTKVASFRGWIKEMIEKN